MDGQHSSVNHNAKHFLSFTDREPVFGCTRAKMPQSRLHKRLTREYCTWFCASAQPAPAASICVQPGSERGFCERAAPRCTCLWDKRPPVWFPGPQPAAGLQRYSERCSAGLKEHRAVWITSVEEGLFVSICCDIYSSKYWHSADIDKAYTRRLGKPARLWPNPKKLHRQTHTHHTHL